MIKIDEDKFHIITIGLLILLVLATYFTFKTLAAINQTAQQKLQCEDIIDAIYENCAEENRININTASTWNGIKGRNVTLKYEYGVCTIK